MYYQCIPYCTIAPYLYKAASGASPATTANSPSSLWSPQTGFYHQYFLSRPVVETETETEQYKSGIVNEQTALCVYLLHFLEVKNSWAKKCLECSINSILASHHSRDRGDCVRAGGGEGSN